jgi:hypothetical protein
MLYGEDTATVEAGGLGKKNAFWNPLGPTSHRRITSFLFDMLPQGYLR